MPHLIDGHNLIGKHPGIELSEIDDEQRLIDQLGRWCQRVGKHAIVYFDRRSLLGDDPRPQHGVTAHFVTSPRTADDAIQDHLARLGPRAQNWTVVSSDRAVQQAAKRAGARVIRSEDFLDELKQGADAPAAPEKPAGLTPSEIDHWLEVFRRGKDRSDR